MMINIKGSNPTELESIVEIVPEWGALYFIEIDEAIETIKKAFESAHAYCVIRRV